MARLRSCAIGRNSAVAESSKFERELLRRVYREDRVKRSAAVQIGAARLVTVRVSGVPGGLFYWMIFGLVSA